MHIVCPICSDLVDQAENIYATKCGHIFHYHCLTQWIERSKSCPQCRHKVTDRCMFRLYPTVSSEPAAEDVVTLQSRLDNVLLKMREHRTKCKEHEAKAASAEAALAHQTTLFTALQKKLDSRDAAISTMKEKLLELQLENFITNKMKEEIDSLKKNLQTLNGLQKVLNATSDEVEQMLEGYSDVRTVATFATALKRALCESESKKNESRDRLQVLKQQLAAEKTTVAELRAKLALVDEKLTTVYRKYKSHLRKRQSDALKDSVVEETPPSKRLKPDLNAAMNLTDTDSFSSSFNSLVNNIENADSPYLRLQQSSLALSALNVAAKPMPDKHLKPSEYALLNSARNAVAKKPEPSQSKSTSIFQKKEPTKINYSQENDPNLSLLNISYDGLGGHSKVDTFPVPKPKPTLKSCIPKLSAKHKLRRPDPVGNQNICKMLEKIRDK